MRILVVEDEPLLADTVAAGLRHDAHAVDVVYDGAAALERAGVNDYDVMILDRDLPVVHGDEVCRRLAGRDATLRIIMLTAAADIDDRVEGLALGADDYLPKPFAFRELAARVAALGRRSRPAAPPVLRRSGISLDPHRREVFRDGRYVPLSRKEFAVLAELLRADGTAVSAEQLLEKAWDENADPFTHAVRMTILKLRRKLGNPPVLLTEPGVGYRIG
jgi:DNA-binding response OmpR family regulator